MSRRAEAILVAAAVAASVAAVLIAPRPLRIPFATLFLLVLPGYLASLALFAPTDIRRVDRVVVALAVSIAIVVLVALLLHVTVGLREGTWMVAIAAVEVVAYVGALARGRRWSARPRPLSLPRVGARDAALLVVALGLVTAATALARTPFGAKHVDGYTALSIVPAQKGRAVRIGVASGELEALRYTLVVREGRRRIYRRNLPALAPGTETVRVVRLPRRGSGTVSALLYRTGHLRLPYRRVTLHVRRGA